MPVSLIALCLLASPDWTPLFDGKSLDGWSQKGGKATFSVKSGEIVGKTVSGSPNSYLCTDKVYGDFELEFDVWVDPKLKSGVQFRSASVPGYKDGVVHGYQVVIDPVSRSSSGAINDESRRGGFQIRTKGGMALKAMKLSQWNRYRVVAKGDHLQTWVNNIPISNIKDDLTSFGFIGLQVQGNSTAGLEVKWRNVRVLDLGIPTANPPKEGHWLLKVPEDIKNWEPVAKPGQSCAWQWLDGALQGVPGSGDHVTKEKFTDCRLHLEFMVDENGKSGQSNGNSGVYMMQSYETQILNSAPRGPLHDECGGIYGIKAPDYAMAMPPGVWQSYDILFTAPKWDGDQKVADARITVTHNGTLIHRNITLPTNTTSGKEEGSGPQSIRLQDHGHKIRFRNIWVSPQH